MPDLFDKTAIALERRLYRCRNVITLGVRTNFSDYPAREAELIRGAEKIYYPSVFYADILNAMGTDTFPSYHNYKSVQDKIKQTALLEITGAPHPRTRTYYGKRRAEKILRDFDYPFVAKVPRGSAMGRGVFLIENETDLARYTESVYPAYIQEYLESDRCIRVIVIGKRAVHAYWRIAPSGDFRNNLAVGGTISRDPVPEEAVFLALTTAAQCGWNDVGLDLIAYQGKYFILEANMKYGREGLARAGIDYYALMEEMIASQEI